MAKASKAAGPGSKVRGRVQQVGGGTHRALRKCALARRPAWLDGSTGKSPSSWWKLGRGGGELDLWWKSNGEQNLDEDVVG